MNNLLQFPDSTIVDKLIPKAQFVKASSTPTAIRTLLADEFEQIRLLYVLRPDTVNVADGNEYKRMSFELFVTFVVSTRLGWLSTRSALESGLR